jgi:predicted Zn-dependent protease
MAMRNWRTLVSGLAALALAATAPASAQEVLRDAETEQFLKDVTRPMIIAANLDPKSVQVMLVGDPSINAFACCGQNVFINSGTIATAENVNWIQGVLAHELGHVAGGHNVRFGEGAGPATNISILSLLGAVAAVAAGAGEAGMAILGLGTAAAQGSFLSFTRDQESRADQAGAQYLSAAHLSGRGSIEFFKKLENQEYRLAIPQTKETEYARTHPLSSTRIANLEAVYEADPAWNTPPDPALNARFLRIRGKLIGYVEEPKRVLQLYPKSDQSIPAHYARAYAWHRSAYVDQATAEADALLKTAPDDPYFLELKGQILLESGKVQEAIPVLRRAVKFAPDQPLIATLLGHALIASEDKANFAEAKPLLKQAIARDRENPFAWYQLGVIYDREGDQPRASLAAAERFSLEGNTRAAVANAIQARSGLPRGTPDWLRADDIALAGQDELAKKKKR